MKKVVKIIIILIVFLACSTSISRVYAAPTKGTDGSGGGGQTSNATTSSQSTSTNWSRKSPGWWNPSYRNIDVGQDKIASKANVITTALRNVGIVVAVIALMLIGIKEMTAGIEEKSELKKALPGYLLGILLVVTVSVLPSIIYGFAKNF